MYLVDILVSDMLYICKCSYKNNETEKFLFLSDAVIMKILQYNSFFFVVMLL